MLARATLTMMQVMQLMHLVIGAVVPCGAMVPAIGQTSKDSLYPSSGRFLGATLSYFANCRVFHVGQRSRSRRIRAIIRGNGGVGIEHAALPDNQ